MLTRLLTALLLCVSLTTAYAQPTHFGQTGIGGGGALFLPSINPYNTSDVWIACDMSDEFHSTDFGASWSIVDFHQLQSGNNAGHVQFGKNESTLYAINALNETPAPYKSVDGGVNWSPLNDPTGGGAFTIATDPAEPNLIILSDYSNIFCSTDDGLSFSLKYTAISNNSGVHIAGVVFDGQNIYIGTNDGLLISTNGGQSFTRSSIALPANEYMVSFTGSKAGGALRFMCVTLSEQWAGITGAEYTNFKGVYRMDGLSSWTKCTMPQGTIPFFIKMVKGNTNIAYAAGGSENSAPSVVKTTDGGQTWTSVFRTDGNANIFTGWSGAQGDRAWSYGEYALGFDVASTDPNRLVITDLGFPHVSSDGGATWHQAYVKPNDENPRDANTPKGRSYHTAGIDNTTNWRVTWVDSLHLIATFSDIQGVISSDAGETWSLGYTGDNFNSMYYTLVHPSAQTVYAAVSSVHDMYQSTYLTDARIDGGKGQVLFSTNKGKAWQVLHDFQHPVIWLALDPNNANRMYASVIHSTQGGIYVSSDIDKGASSTWTKLASPTRTQGHPMTIAVLNDGTLVCSYSGRRDNAGHFTQSSGVFVSTDQGQSWIDRSSPKQTYWTKDLVVDPHDAQQNTWYTGVFSGWGGGANDLGGLYRTTDRGITWKQILNEPSVTSITVHPVNREIAYATTETQGLWYTSNLSAASPVWSPVTSYPFRQPERVMFNPYDVTDVWVSSFGNGMRHSGSSVIVPIDLLGQVQLMTPTDHSSNVPSPASFVWGSVEKATRYEIVVATDAAFTSIEADDTLTSTTLPSLALPANQTYYWHARAMQNDGNVGAWSTTWSFTTGKATPAQVTLITPGANALSQTGIIHFSWTTVQNAETFRIQISTTQDFSTILKEAVVTLSVLNDTLPTGVYYWRVAAQNQTSQGPWSTTRMVTVGSLGVVEHSISRYSYDPSTATLTLAPEAKVSSIELLDVLGRSVRGFDPHNQVISLRGLGIAKGSYFLRVNTDAVIGVVIAE